MRQTVSRAKRQGPIMDTAPNVIEMDAYCSRQPHMPIEPDVAYAYTDEEGRLTIHSKSIGIHLHHAHDLRGHRRGTGKSCG